MYNQFPCFFLFFSTFPSRIRIRIQYADPDPGRNMNMDPYGSGSTTLLSAHCAQKCRTCFSSNVSQVASVSSFRSCTVDWIAPPQDFMVRWRSSSGTRPAQNMSRSAKYWNRGGDNQKAVKSNTHTFIYDRSLIVHITCSRKQVKKIFFNLLQEHKKIDPRGLPKIRLNFI